MTSQTNNGNNLFSMFLLITIILGIILCVAPGHMNGDSLTMFTQATLNQYSDWHYPVISIIWHWLWPNERTLFFTLKFFTIAFAYLIRQLLIAFGLPKTSANYFCALLLITPTVLGWLGTHSKDVWAAVGFLAVLLLTAHYQKTSRIYWLVLQVIVAILSCLVRPELIVIYSLFFILQIWANDNHSLKYRFVCCAILICTMLSGIKLATAIIDKQFKVAHIYIAQQLYAFDLASLSIKTNQLLLPSMTFPAQNLDILKKHYNPTNIVPLCFGKPDNEMLKASFNKSEVTKLRNLWLQNVVKYLPDYLAARAHIFSSYLQGYVWFSEGIEPNNFGIQLINPTLHTAMLNYLNIFDHTIITSHYFYLIGEILLILAANAYISEKPTRRLIIATLLTCIAYQLLFFIITVSPDFRYAYTSVVVFWLVLYLLIGKWISNKYCHPSRCSG